jgi:hypothetical protein
LLKYCPARIGVTLYVATPTIGSSERFVARKKQSAVSPARSVTCACVGLKRQGRLLAMSVLNVIRIGRLRASEDGSAGSLAYRRSTSEPSLLVWTVPP